SEGHIEVGQSADVVVDQRRSDVMRHHTATHLMNHALRRVLGDHIEQRGSLVDHEKLRFDFSHDKSLSADEVHRIEQIVNQQILANIRVQAVTMPLDEAKKIKGVRAVFGEKYPDPVRVIAVANEEVTTIDAVDCSVEFCGGTHIGSTGEIGFFKITAEESLSKGIRRVTAVTGVAASGYVRHLEAMTKQITQALSTTLEDAPRRIAALQEEIKTLKKKLATGGGAALPSPADAAEKLVAEAVTAGDTKIVIGRFNNGGADYLASVMDAVKSRAPSVAMMLAGVDDERIAFLASVSEDVIKKGLKAGDWIRDTAKIAGGGGGGRPNFAQAGGKDPAKADDALKTAKEIAVTKLA
ncbi:MAG TPA: DHHA1 domain-containing protein, partial [Tepidisphaeraceae bacterium]